MLLFALLAGLLLLLGSLMPYAYRENTTPDTTPLGDTPLNNVHPTYKRAG